MEGSHTHRGYSEALVAAQARILLEGVRDTLALSFGPETPDIQRVTVVFDAERADGAEVHGVVSVSDDGSALSEDRTIAMLASGTAAMTMRHFFGFGDEEADDAA